MTICNNNLEATICHKIFKSKLFYINATELTNSMSTDKDKIHVPKKCRIVLNHAIDGENKIHLPTTRIEGSIISH